MLCKLIALSILAPNLFIDGLLESVFQNKQICSNQIIAKNVSMSEDVNDVLCAIHCRQTDGCVGSKTLSQSTCQLFVKSSDVSETALCHTYFTDAKPLCPDGYHQDGSVCYHFRTIANVNWLDAVASCPSDGFMIEADYAHAINFGYKHMLITSKPKETVFPLAAHALIAGATGFTWASTGKIAKISPVAANPDGNCAFVRNAPFRIEKTDCNRQTTWSVICKWSKSRQRIGRSPQDWKFDVTVSSVLQPLASPLRTRFTAEYKAGNLNSCSSKVHKYAVGIFYLDGSCRIYYHTKFQSNYARSN